MPQFPKGTKFYMVYVHGKGSSQYRHMDEKNARGEAERLAKKEGRRVYILETIASVEIADPEWTELRDKE